MEKKQRQHDKQAALRQDLLAQQAEARRRAAQAGDLHSHLSVASS